MPSPSRFDVMRPAAGFVRVVRSFAIALLCTATASFGHVFAGGEIAASAVAILFSGAAAVAWLVSSRRVTPGQLIGLLVLCQVCVHLGCSMGSMNMSASMLATHAAATVVSALALARGEAFVWGLAERLGLQLRPLVFDFAPIPSRIELIPVTTTRSRRDVRLAYSRPLRGPPYGSS